MANSAVNSVNWIVCTRFDECFICWRLYPVMLSTFASFSLSFFFISAVLVGLYRYLRFPVHS